jgi:hypothetical protein
MMNCGTFIIAINVVMLCIYCVIYNTLLWVRVLHNHERLINK